MDERPAHRTAEEADQTIVTPGQRFVAGPVRYRLCDKSSMRPAGRPAAAPPSPSLSPTLRAGAPALEVPPEGPGWTRLRPAVATGWGRARSAFPWSDPLDRRRGRDGSISPTGSAQGVKRGRRLWLATQSAQTLAEQPFEVVGGPIPWPVRLALGAGALVVGALARIASRRWQASREERRGRRPAEQPDVRAEPHTRPVEVDVEPVPDGTRTVAVRLQPHPDPGTQALNEVTR